MPRSNVQTTFPAPQKTHLGSLKELLSCHGVWNLQEARFERCILPLISLLPGIISILILLSRVCCSLPWKMPAWLQPFVEEFDGKNHPPRLKTRRRWTATTISLLGLSVAGFILEIISALYPFTSFAAMLPAISWVFALNTNVDSADGF